MMAILSFNNRNADGDNNGWNFALNGLWQSDSHVYVNGVLGFGKESNELTRNDNTSDFDSKTLSAMLEVGKRVEQKNYTWTPYVSLLGVKYKRDGLRESGTGAGLNVGSQSNSYLTSALGVRIGRDYKDRNGGTRGGIMLGLSWQHQFSDTGFPVRSSLQSAAGMTPVSFTTYGTPLSSNSLGVQLGAYGRLSRNILGFLNYSGNFSSNQKLNSIAAGMEYRF